MTFHDTTAIPIKVCNQSFLGKEEKAILAYI